MECRRVHEKPRYILFDKNNKNLSQKQIFNISYTLHQNSNSTSVLIYFNLGCLSYAESNSNLHISCSLNTNYVINIGITYRLKKHTKKPDLSYKV